MEEENSVLWGWRGKPAEQLTLACSRWLPGVNEAIAEPPFSIHQQQHRSPKKRCAFLSHTQTASPMPQPHQAMSVSSTSSNETCVLYVLNPFPCLPLLTDWNLVIPQQLSLPAIWFTISHPNEANVKANHPPHFGSGVSMYFKTVDALSFRILQNRQCLLSQNFSSHTSSAFLSHSS